MSTTRTGTPTTKILAVAAGVVAGIILLIALAFGIRAMRTAAANKPAAVTEVTASPTSTTTSAKPKMLSILPNQWTEWETLPPHHWFEIDWPSQYYLDVENISGKVVRIHPSDNLPDSSNNRRLRFRAGGPYSFEIKFSMAPKK